MPGGRLMPFNMPDLINGVPLVWDDGEDLFGSLYNDNANLSINSIKKEGPIMIAFPSIKGPFEEDEIYKNEFITLDINLQQLIGDIKKFRENKQTINFDYSNYTPKVNANKESSVTIASTTNVSMGDKQIPFSVNNTNLRIRGLLNTKIDVVDFGRKHEFDFQFNPYAETISFGIWFTYKTFKSSEQESRYAIGLETWFYADFKKLLDHLGILVSDTEQKYIISRYNIAFNNAKNDPDKIDFLYEYAPDFVIRSISDEVLFYHLHLLVGNRIDSIGTNENIAVINLINGIKNKKRFYDQINSNPEIIRRLFEKFTPVHIPELVSALCLVGYSVWDERDFKKIIKFVDKLEYTDWFDDRVNMKVVGWCYYLGDIKKYEIGYTVYTYEGSPLPSSSTPRTSGLIMPFSPLSMNADDGEIYIPAFVAEYYTNIKLEETRKNLLDSMLIGLMPQSSLFKLKSLAIWSKISKNQIIKTTDELIIYLSKIEDGFPGVNLDKIGIKTLFRGTTKNSSMVLFQGNPNTIQNGISTSTDPIRATIFAIEAQSINKGTKGLLQIGLTKDLKDITLVAPNYRVEIEMEVILKTSANNFSKMSKEISIDQARKLIKEVYNIDLPTSIRDFNDSRLLLETVPISTLEEAVIFQQKAYNL